MNDIRPGEPVIIFDYTVVLTFPNPDMDVERKLTLRKRESEGRMLDPNGEQLVSEAVKRACKKAHVDLDDVKKGDVGWTVRWTRSRLTTAR